MTWQMLLLQTVTLQRILLVEGEAYELSTSEDNPYCEWVLLHSPARPLDSIVFYRDKEDGRSHVDLNRFTPDGNDNWTVAIVAADLNDRVLHSLRRLRAKTLRAN